MQVPESGSANGSAMAGSDASYDAGGADAGGKWVQMPGGGVKAEAPLGVQYTGYLPQIAGDTYTAF